jgi:hypothetical protein
MTEGFDYPICPESDLPCKVPLHESSTEKIMSKIILFITLISIILGCASTGREYNTLAIDNIEIGKTTDNDVISMLGEPISKEMFNNGINIFQYKYAKSYLWGASKSINTLQVQCYNGIVINKWQRLAWD